MSVKLMSEVFGSSLPTAQRFVLLVLADHASDDGTNAWPAIGTIAAKTGLGASTVRRALRELETLGAVEQTAEANTERKTAVYRVVASCIPRPEWSGFRAETPTDAGADALTSTPTDAGGDPNRSKRGPQPMRAPNHPLTTLEPPIKAATPSVDNNPNQPSHDQLYLAEQLGDQMTPAAVVKLNKSYGRDAVTNAMRRLRGFPPEGGIDNAYAYLLTILDFEKAGAA